MKAILFLNTLKSALTIVVVLTDLIQINVERLLSMSSL